MNLIKKLYIHIISKLFWIVRLPLSVRDFFMWPIATRVLSYSFVPILTLISGIRIHAYMNDQIGRLAIFYGKRFPYFWEPSTTQLVEILSRNAREVLVAGSHIGLMALHARKSMKASEGNVHTFEPIGWLFDIAKENFKLNEKFGSIKITQCALGDVSGSVTMTDDRLRSKIIDPQTISRHKTQSVPIMTIDAYAAQHHVTSFDFVLLDVEGYELQALTGMKKLLTENPPRDIIYEIIKPTKNNFSSVHTIESLLKPLGYTMYIVQDISDPLFMDKRTLTPSITLIPANEESYSSHKNDRYFNVYATLRAEKEVQDLGAIEIQHS